MSISRSSIWRAGTRAASRAGLVSYGVIAQSCSAATNFGLVVLAGHLLGPARLGTILIGFSTYAVILGLQRALITDPLVTGSSADGPAERSSSARSALTIAGVSGLAGSVMLVVIGTALPSRFGFGMVLFVPWLAAALVQDVGRSILFRDRHARSVVLSDAAWLVAMGACVPLAITLRSSWAVVGCWGAGAVAAALVVLVQVRWRPTSLRSASSWWKRKAWRFGRWLGAQGVVTTVVPYATTLAIAGILGARDYGGFRAVQSMFAPLTTLATAFALPGLPRVSRALALDPRRALSLSIELAVLITVATAAYLVAIYLVPDLLPFFFGPKFAQYRSIIIPIGVGQLIVAPIFGLLLFLKAAQRGPTILWLALLSAMLYLAAAVALGLLYGLTGVAWSGAAAGIFGLAAMTAVIRANARAMAHGPSEREGNGTW